VATTHDQVVEEVQDIVVSGTTDAIVSRWLNRRYRTMVAKSRWRTAEEEVATTVADQTDYNLDTNFEVYEVLGIKVVDATDATEAQYQPTSTRQGWGITDNSLVLEPGAKLFRPGYDTNGTVKQVGLIPTPDTTGDSIVGLLSLYPASVSGSNNLIIPDEFVTPLVRGIAADVMALDDEQQTEAGGHEAAFQSAIMELYALGQRKVAPGPTTVPIQGYGFR